jgi:hypothetical protein
MIARDAGRHFETETPPMTKRIALLVVVLTVFAAPAAMADHCFRCKIVPAPEVSYCIYHTNAQFLGWTECYSDETGCFVSGDRCYGHPVQASTPLAADYEVASVERLDEPQTAASETVLAAAAPAKR